MVAYQILLNIITYAFLAFLLVCFIKSRKNHEPKGKESAFAGLCWLSVFLVGLALSFGYAVIKEKPQGANVLIALATALDRTLCMFSFRFGHSELVKEAWAEGGLGIAYAISVFMVYVGAGVWTYSILVKTFLKGIHNAFKLWCRKRMIGGANYILIGTGKEVEQFAKNLQKRSLRWCDSLTLITGEPKDGKTAEQWYKNYLAYGYTVAMGRADKRTLCRAGLKNRLRRTILIALSSDDEQNVAVAELATEEICRRVKKKIKISAKNTSIKDFSKAVRNLIENKRLTKNEETLLKIADNESEAQKRAKCKKALETLNVEARISYRNIDRTEHFVFTENAFGKINFFNLYEIRARQFFKTHPITNRIADMIDASKGRLAGKWQNGSIVKEADNQPYRIRHVFIGFGNGNYQMLRAALLYTQILGVDFSAIVYADDIKDKEHLSVSALAFKHQSPALFGKTEMMADKMYLEDPKEKYLVEFRHGNVLSKDFYEDLYKEIKDDDYTAIYISLGDDMTDVETALEIRQTLATKGLQGKKIDIYAKTRRKSAILSGDILNALPNTPWPIHCFGFDEEVLSQEDIVALELERTAETLTNGHHDLLWFLASESKKDSNRTKILFLPVVFGFVGVTLNEFPTEKNPIPKETIQKLFAAYANNNATKAVLDQISNFNICKKDMEGLRRGGNVNWEEITDHFAKIGIAQEDIESIRQAQSNPAEQEKCLQTLQNKVKKLQKLLRMNYVQRNQNGEIEDCPRNNLARLEHLRWDALYAVMGWTKKPLEEIGCNKDSDDDPSYYFGEKEAPLQFEKYGRRNGITKQHACITTLEGLLLLRKLQAVSANEQARAAFLDKIKVDATGNFLLNEQIDGEELFDTTAYDFDLLDELAR